MKLKEFFGEELLYEIGPFILIPLLIVAGLVAIIF